MWLGDDSDASDGESEAEEEKGLAGGPAHTDETCTDTSTLVRQVGGAGNLTSIVES